jgi:hypothetical protein
VEIDREVEESQIRPIAGIWSCPNCGRRIQVITDSDQPEVQPFTCVCATQMEPGEEHAELPEVDEDRHRP